MSPARGEMPVPEETVRGEEVDDIATRTVVATTESIFACMVRHAKHKESAVSMEAWQELDKLARRGPPA